MSIRKFLMAFFALFFISLLLITHCHKAENLPVVAIANYGSHSCLNDSIVGIKSELARQGFVENKTVRFEIADVGFDTSLIPQMIMSLKSHSPKVMVVVATPVAQFAHGAIKDIPLIYNVITDPVSAGLEQMTGSSDKQDLNILLQFVKQLMPQANRVGILYSTSEANDLTLVKLLHEAAQKLNMTVLPVAVDQGRDVQLRMQQFKNKVDVIYVGGSGAIQPTLPVIAAEANKMKIPVLNVNEDAIKEGLVLASFGVSYQQVGVNTGKLVAKVLKGADVKTLQSLYPTREDHHGFINLKKANELGLVIPKDLKQVEIVE